MRGLWGAIAIAMLPLGCAANRMGDLERRQRDIEMRIRVDERRAAELRSETLKLRNESSNLRQQTQQLAMQMQTMNTCMQWSRCDAKRAAFEARVQQHVALCNKQVSVWYQCQAQKHKKTSGLGGLGCLLGGAFAVASGGALLPAVGIGCGAGLGVGAASGIGDCKKLEKPKACHGPRLVQQTTWELGPAPNCGVRPPQCATLVSVGQ